MLGLQIILWILCLSPLIFMGLLSFIVWRSRRLPILSIIGIIFWSISGICVLTFIGLYPAYKYVARHIDVLEAKNAVDSQCGTGHFNENAVVFDDSDTLVWYESDELTCTRSPYDRSWTCDCG